MKLLSSLLMSALLCTPCLGQSENSQAQINYALGYWVGDHFLRKNIDIDPNILMLGIRDAVVSDARLSPREIQQSIDSLGLELVANTSEFADKKAAYKKNNEHFLSKNKLKKNVISLPSGLQYEVIQQGHGMPLEIGDRVDLHYTARLINGQEFENSRRYNQPLSMLVRDAFSGLQEALLLMKPGAHWTLFIPPELAFGSEGAKSRVPGNSTIIFDVEVLSVFRIEAAQS